MQVLALGFVKLSILYFYRRIFCVVKGDIFDWINKIVVVITIAWSVSFFFAILFSCGTSFYAQWGSIEDTMKHCKIGMPLQNGYGISDFILDVFVLIMPIPKACEILNICHLDLLLQDAYTFLDLVTSYEHLPKNCCDSRFLTRSDVNSPFS